MSLLIRSVRPANIQAYIAANAAGSLKATATESLRAFFIAGGATGSSLAELERSYIGASSGQTYTDKWGGNKSATSGTTTKEKLRNFFK